MILQTPTNNNERRSDEILEMAVWLDMESSPAGYGQEEMNLPLAELNNNKGKHNNDRNESKQQMVLYVSEMAWRAVV